MRLPSASSRAPFAARFRSARFPFALGIALFLFAAAMLFTTSIIAAQKSPSPKSASAAAPAQRSAVDNSATQNSAVKNSAAARAADGALFTAFVPVLRHPRCMNCHSRGDFPRQGDDGHPHAMNVRRGPEGHGVTAQKCTTCHQDHNLAGPHLPPGAPNWALPPRDMPMIWQGLTDAQLCRSIKDPQQNKNRDLAQLVEHLTEDKLVMWGWDPGPGRTPVSIPHDEFSARVKRWQAAGAPCPADARSATN